MKILVASDKFKGSSGVLEVNNEKIIIAGSNDSNLYAIQPTGPGEEPEQGAEEKTPEEIEKEEAEAKKKGFFDPTRYAALFPRYSGPPRRLGRL